ncbi:MAG: stage II sporulation protein M [bacterium]|nr:stage II sporulation protein M [bacterium]
MSIWALLWFAIGTGTYLVRPDLLESVSQFLDRVFRDIWGDKAPALDFSAVLLIFSNNLEAALLALFLGIIIGIVPLMVAALNFFILGFLFAIFALPYSPSGALIFAAAVVPHGIIEIPALLVASAFGLRLGLDWKNWKVTLGQNIQIAPLLAALLFLAAVIEVFVSGKLVEQLAK